MKELSKYRLSDAYDKLTVAKELLDKDEKQFFYKPNELKKTFIKGIEKKRL